MQENKLIELFNSFNDCNVLIIGDVMVDAYLWGKVDRISPEAPVPIIACDNRENRMGGAANVALNIMSLGATPILCSVIGDDLKSPIFLKLLEKRKLTSSGILIHKDRKTTVKTRIISDNQHLLRVDDEIITYLSPEIEELFITHISKLIAKLEINAIIFQDYDKGVITPKVITEITKLANGNNIPTLVDPKKRNFDSYKNVTLFKPNFKELTEGLNFQIEKKDFEGIRRAVQQIHENRNIDYVLITLSELGMFISKRTVTDDNSISYEQHRIKAEIRYIADVSGAGDTVISTASLCLAVGCTPFEISSISNLAGGLVCEKSGVVPINKELLLNESIAFFKQAQL